MELIIGSHVSFEKKEQLLGSVKETISYGANAFMFYTGAPQNTVRSLIDDKLTKEALELMKKSNININNVVVHAPYIINLASSDESKRNFAISFLKEEIKRVEKLGIKKIILHPGSHTGDGVEKGLEHIISGLKEILKNTNVIICLETMSGKGTELGKKFEEIKNITDNVDNVMVCLDTCHINDAGYDISNFDQILEEFDKIIGLDKLGCIHVNDSKNIINSHKDRHDNIGFGTLGFDNLIKIVYNDKLKDVPKILETPYISTTNDSKDRIYPPYKFEIEMIKNKKFNSNLLEEIREFYR